VFAVLGFVFGLMVISGVLFVVGALVFGRGEEVSPAPRDSTPVVLPADHPPDAADIEALRLSVVLRGYRMHEVDWVLDQLAEALRERDRQLAALTNQLTRQAAAQALVSPDGAAPDGATSDGAAPDGAAPELVDPDLVTPDTAAPSPVGQLPAEGRRDA